MASDNDHQSGHHRTVGAGGESAASVRPLGVRNVILTGFMGTGKSTVGRLLADLILMEWVDTDDLIEMRHGPIPEIFANAGEPAFRACERAVADELAARSGLVVSTGGLLMLDPTNRALLSANSRIFCLVASPSEIAKRLGEGSAEQRPLLMGHDLEERMHAILAERSYEYSRFEQIQTDGITPEDIAVGLVERLQEGSP